MDNVVVTLGLATMCSVMEHRACPPGLVAVKVMTNVPNCSAPGVQLNTLDTGFPVVGNAGVIVEPEGKPTPFSDTTSPKSGSDACTVNVKALPTCPLMVDPQAGVGP